jgi:hypothetical protein
MRKELIHNSLSRIFETLGQKSVDFLKFHHTYVVDNTVMPFEVCALTVVTCTFFKKSFRLYWIKI